MSNDSEVFEYHREPGFMIRRLHQIATSIFMEKAKQYEVTPIQFAALNAIERHSGIDQRQIARFIAIDRTTMNIVTKRLEERGWIIRTRRGRRLDLALTPQGRAMLNEVTNSVADHHEELLSPITQTERKTFLSLLERLIEKNNELSRVPVSKPEPDVKRDQLVQ
jgi:DNA-binding MarR family transcriptional regulator